MYAKKTILLLPIKIMSVVAKRKLHCRYESVRKLLNLRLCKQSQRVLYEKNAWNGRTYVRFQNNTKINEDSQPNKNVLYDEMNPITEREKLYLIMKNSAFYKDTIVPPIKSRFYVTKDAIDKAINMNWEQSSSLECLNAIKVIAHYHLIKSYLSEEKYCQILKELKNKIPEFKDHEIKILMSYLIALKNNVKKLKPYERLVHQLDYECLKRFFGSNVVELLWTIDAFYQLDMYNCSYMWRALRKISSKLEKLSGKNLVQFLFYISVCKFPDLHMFEVECYLIERMSEISPDELGIVARGFFLTKRKVTQKDLMIEILNKTEKHISSMNNVSVEAVIKLIRYSDSCNLKSHFQKTLQNVKVDRLNLLSLTHIAQGMGGTRVYNGELLNSIVQRLEEDYSSARLKDIERILFCVCLITPYTEGHDLCRRIMNPLLSTYRTTRSEEVFQYPYSMVHIVGFLIHKNIYIEELIRFVLTPEYVKNTHKNNMTFLTGQYLFLQCSIQIELPNYTGPLLDDKIYNCLIQKNCRRTDVYEKHNSMKFMSEVIYLCKEKLGLQAHTDFILPHYYTSDIILGFDKNNNSVPIEPILSEMPPRTIKRVDTEDLRKIKWKVIYLLSSTTNVIGHDGYVCSVYMKCRQLKTIGYTPIILSYRTWKVLAENEKVPHLKKIIFQENTDFLQN
ncbi:FAST kinase domain-containing protein 5, mitochondrial [Nomia melanderi]|uniref:FAST kinase domain-containing protein 5, mitochondrial n=1 Tax=Nomia melanderi TaxID=2448451 RepID=UPI001303F894|nr:uncharacterized protein LOC116430224 [Nomia melanderi]